MQLNLNAIKQAIGSLFRHTPKQNTLFVDVLKEYIEAKFIMDKLDVKTNEKHKYQLNNIIKFLSQTNQQTITIDQIKIKFVEDLRFWLHVNIHDNKKKSCSVDHVTRHLRMCREACSYAVKREYIEANKIAGIKMYRSKAKEIVSLSIHEVAKLESYQSNNQNWNFIRDLFLFQCFTGISYIDLWMYEIVFDQGICWVSCKSGRGKTNKLYWAELSKKAKVIHDKYDGKFPHVCNQTYNKTIKKITKSLGINKTITTHIGRKTFATLRKHDGYSNPAIAEMMGCTEIVLGKHYISRGKELIISERAKLNKVVA